MSEFTKVYKKWHTQNNRKYVSASKYHKALMNNFKDWQPPKELVEVPQCVDDAIKALPKYYSVYGAIEWIRAEIIDFEKEYEDWLDVYNWIFKENNANKFARAWLDGYTVEKEKLYLLKHIDFCKTDKDYDWFMIKFSDGALNHLRVEKGQKPATIDCKFTQQEIDSMETGSYEQLEVEV